MPDRLKSQARTGVNTALVVLDIAAHKNWGSHTDAPHSRQPLVKGERLVRYEVNAVIPIMADFYVVHVLQNESKS